MTYKPGQLAKATVRGVRGVTIVRHDYRPGHNAYSVTFEWFDITTASWVLSVDVTDVRPLVVLDPSNINPNHAPNLVRLLRDAFWLDLADQIEAQTRPAIEEPTGLGAVVEDSHRGRWVHVGAGTWRADSAVPANVAWDLIDVVRVLSEGVPS